MSLSIYGNSFRTLLSKIFLKNFAPSSFFNWEPNAFITVGDYRIKNKKLYIAASSGVSGVIAPTHTSGIASDGNVNWIFLEQNFQSNNIYGFIGKASDWSTEPTPEYPVINQSTIGNIRKNIIALKKIVQRDVSLGINRYDWTAGTVYKEYTDGRQEEPKTVLVDGRRVYTCICNNEGSPSTSKPTSTSLSQIRYGDGYIWKYVYTISEIDAQKFITANKIPIPGTFNTAQYSSSINGISHFLIRQRSEEEFFDEDVEYTVIGDGTGCQVSFTKDTFNKIKFIDVKNTGTGYTKRPTLLAWEKNYTGSSAQLIPIITDGVLTGVTIQNAGSNYTHATAFLIGDGTGARLACSITNGAISEVEILSGGDNYTTGTIYVLPGQTAIAAEGILSPTFGHGANIQEELGASCVILNISFPENSYFQNDQEYRQFGLLVGGKDSKGDEMFLDYYIGKSHEEYGNSGLNKHNENTGEVVYLNNVSQIIRSPNKEERTKLSINF